MDMDWGTEDIIEICVCRTLAPMLLSPCLQMGNFAAERNAHKWCSHCRRASTPGPDSAKGKEEREPRETGAAGQAAAPRPPARQQTESGSTVGPEPNPPSKSQWLLLYRDLPDIPQSSLEANLNQKYSVVENSGKHSLV